MKVLPCFQKPCASISHYYYEFVKSVYNTTFKNLQKAYLITLHEIIPIVFGKRFLNRRLLHFFNRSTENLIKEIMSNYIDSQPKK